MKPKSLKTAWVNPALGFSLLLSLMLSFTLASSVQATVPGQINFQGLLLDSAGDPVNGLVDLVFTMFDADTGGSSLWTETHNDVDVVDGVYNAALGSTTPITTSILAGGSVYLEIEVDGETLSPRQRLLAVPYAINAENAVNAENAASASSVNGLSSSYLTAFIEQADLDGGDPPNTDPTEGFADTDNDGTANFLDSDNDNDGQSDVDELAAGTDINLITPVITALVPPSAEGSITTTTVEVQGQFFEVGMTVVFGSENPTPTNITPTSFDVEVGPQAEGIANVVATRLNGESDSSSFDFIYFDPIVESFDPYKAPPGSPTNVTVTGQNFLPGLTAAFGSENPTPSNITSTTFDVTVGGPQPDGTVNVVVTLPSGKNTSVPYTFSLFRRVFVSDLYKGDYGGLSGADAVCNAEALAAGRIEIFKAWLADGSDSPDTRFDKNVGPYLLYNDTLVANDWSDLTDGTINAAINRTADNAVISSTFRTRSNVATNGQAIGSNHCLDWTNATSGENGNVGNADEVGSQWTVNGTLACNLTARLYCFEE